MAPGFPVRINGVLILTVEALYQACRFPHMPEVQRRILEQHSPMTAKMVGKPYRAESRPDWDRVRVKIMRWCLRLKLLMHRSSFGDLLLSTGDRPIVEDSRKDDFWGALHVGSETLVGGNVLGRLLMELREEIKSGTELRFLEPPAIPSFLLYGKAIGLFDFRTEQEIQRSQMVDKVQVHMKVPSLPLFPELFPESKSENSSFANPQQGGSQEYNLLRGAQPYAEYKDSGLHWLGVVPVHWDLRPVFGAFVPNHERNSGMKENTVLSLSYGRIVIKPADKLHGLVPESFETYQIVNPGDIVLRTTDLQNDHTSLRVGMVKDRGIITSAYLALRAIREVNPTFGFQVLNVWDTSKAIYGYGSGLRQGLDFSHFKRMPVAVPPPDEQDAIVRFLDWANGRLDRAIRAKRKVIALLNEQKQAITHRAVTRGLDSSVPVKPSGIPWLGDIPQHWEVLRAKYLYREMNDRSSDGSEELLSVSHITGVTPRSQKNVTMFKAASYAGHKLCRPGDLAVNTMWAWMGALGVSTYDGIISPGYAVYRPIRPDRIVGEYIDGVLRSKPYISNIICSSTGLRASRLRLYPEQFFRLPIILPPAEEQRQIVQSIQLKTAGQDATISRLEREIDLLREYRTRLMTDVVTGKLDVREAVAKLPVEEQAIEPIELVEDDSEMIEDEITEPAE